MAPSLPDSIPVPIPQAISPVHRNHENGEAINSDPIVGPIIIKPREGYADPIVGPLVKHNEYFEEQGLQPSQPVEPQNIADRTFLKESDQIGVCDGTAKDGAVVIPPKRNGKRTVHWVDDYGKNIAEVREFEPSDSGDSDEDEDSDSSQSCNCVIQ
ncbi:hypothetical protein O6H91_01G087400 [Diphasiastrum complanatum]|uniref:Uncharacterized protein n=2 Tax=Diphasiastrum complanatum TaxID=34168 RepID=A0ACC2ESU6_DIPCM|nr:hypothetical protein O6H91_05G003900 [Diphasiastrum complanatum]KAJ7569654.1 hypothetical protein O6H91_01G087400 [Diphasiastrum complanatum]